MKKTVRIKESELKEIIERMLNEHQPQPETDDPDIETMEPEVDPGIETDKPQREPWEDPFTPRRISPGTEPQPRAQNGKKRRF